MLTSFSRFLFLSLALSSATFLLAGEKSEGKKGIFGGLFSRKEQKSEISYPLHIGGMPLRRDLYTMPEQPPKYKESPKPQKNHPTLPTLPAHELRVRQQQATHKLVVNSKDEGGEVDKSEPTGSPHSLPPISPTNFSTYNHSIITQERVIPSLMLAWTRLTFLRDNQEKIQEQLFKTQKSLIDANKYISATEKNVESLEFQRTLALCGLPAMACLLRSSAGQKIITHGFAISALAFACSRIHRIQPTDTLTPQRKSQILLSATVGVMYTGLGVYGLKHSALNEEIGVGSVCIGISSLFAAYKLTRMSRKSADNFVDTIA